MSLNKKEANLSYASPKILNEGGQILKYDSISKYTCTLNTYYYIIIKLILN